MTLKMLMVGCTAGEGHLGLTAPNGRDDEAIAGLLEAFEIYGRAQKAFILTFKDFTKDHRAALTPIAEAATATHGCRPFRRRSSTCAPTLGSRITSPAA